MQNSKIKVQNLSQRLKIRKIVIWIILIFTFIHFLKDITQDIFRIPTVLDYFGNIQEDITNYSPFSKTIYLTVAYLSGFTEIMIIWFCIQYIRQANQVIFRNTLLLLSVLLSIYLLFAFYDPKIISLFNAKMN